ncbi:deoxyuridine 5'-triphosphate nucleotidohydrolase [Haloarcula hispanica]|nr:MULTISPECIES: deoxyuridine 5'-triphosphate nucleotidohydrolase [Haloarcula]KAA9406117.1 deoxyuridine 5'-triphosphate nucleotidohydrolase [Haloarcula sp. CBA1131]MCJ0619932.1 deoxyuridine 5'-triphosphate nucleotidohydrolase [Haloarcula hispanica]MUV48877.1 deoxyuridine 5'-triphosphate nucleotidohydrolase [Haloarcula sp. CBA1122]RYJ11606.1 deoxyuridine 5'-triphosphate nucleotidohydrolase [Haloarcula hispanica]
MARRYKSRVFRRIFHIKTRSVRRSEASQPTGTAVGQIGRSFHDTRTESRMFKSGRFVADSLGDLRESQVQPNGVDLTLGAIYEQSEPGRIERGGKTVGDRRELEPSDGIYQLDRGGYIVEYADRVVIPDGHIGFLLPRSSLLRNSCMLDTAVWDAGYEGRGEGLLEVHHPIELEQGARIAQLVLADAAHEGTYEGSYQGENL